MSAETCKPCAWRAQGGSRHNRRRREGGGVSWARQGAVGAAGMDLGPHVLTVAGEQAGQVVGGTQGTC